MRETLDIALQSARSWRDAGTDILIFFLVIEFLLEIWEPKDKWSPWDSKASKYRRSARLLSRLPSKQKLTVIAALAVALGVGLEKVGSNWVDDVTDQIRINLEGVLAHVTPRGAALDPATEEFLASEMKFWAGQRVVILKYCKPNTDTDADVLAYEFAALFDQAGWLDPWGRPFSKVEPRDFWRRKTIDSGWYDEGRAATKGIRIEIDPRASKKTQNGAIALELAGLRLMAGIWDVRLRENRKQWPLPSWLPADKDLIVVTIGSNASLAE